jgi:hypothetical protein
LILKDRNLIAHDRATGALKWTGTVVDLVFGSNSQLRPGLMVASEPGRRPGQPHRSGLGSGVL